MATLQQTAPNRPFDRGGLLALSAAAGCLTAVLSGIIQHQGLILDPDGWAYWQGSVSLLEGHGYCLFYRSMPIDVFPPLFSCYLAAWQWALGVSGRTLIIANVFLNACCALSWCWALLSLARPSAVSLPRWRQWLTAIGVAYLPAGLIPACSEYLLSDNLRLALVPWLVLASMGARLATTRRALFQSTTIAVGVAALMMLAHNSCVAYVAAAAIVIASGRPNEVGRPARWAASAALGLSLAPWIYLRWALGQLGSHPLGFGNGRLSPAEYAQRIIDSIAYLLCPRGAGWMILPLALALAARAALPGPDSGDAGRELQRRARGMLLFAACVTLALFALFNLIWIADRLSPRFLSATALLLVGVAIYRGASLRSCALATACVAALAGIPSLHSFQRAGVGLRDKAADFSPEDRRSPDVFLLRPNHTIRREVVDTGIERHGSWTVIPAPVFPWMLESESNRAQEEDRR